MPSRLPRWFSVLLVLNLLGLIWFFAPSLPATAKPAACDPLTASVHPKPWLQFHRDEMHTGAVTETAGNISTNTGPLVRWKYKVFDATDPLLPVGKTRWASSFPLGDLLGDGKLEVVVTTPNITSTDYFSNRIIALQDTPNGPSPVRALWTYTDTIPGSKGFDMYSPALADADGDGRLDVIAVRSDGHLFVLRGCDGTPLWDPPYEMNHIVESGPVIADLFGDGKKEIIVTTAQRSDLNNCIDGSTPLFLINPGNDCGALFVFALTETVGITNHLIYSQTFPWKMDSAVPAVADVDLDHGTKRKVMFIGTWGGYLVGAWRDPGGAIYTHTLDLRPLEPVITTTITPTIRSAPLVWDFGEGPEVVFSWMPDHSAGGLARISAAKVRANMLDNTLVFTPTWTIQRDAWKSFPTLLPATNPPMVVIGWGTGVEDTPGTNQGSADSCGPPLTGGLVALRVTGNDAQRIAWEKYFTNTLPYEGYRNFAAVADFNGDGRSDVVVANQCFGKLHAFDGLDGAEQWNFQLGPYLLSSPTVGDLAGDGGLEIIEGSLDGYVWALTGGTRAYLPFITR